MLRRAVVVLLRSLSLKYAAPLAFHPFDRPSLRRETWRLGFLCHWPLQNTVSIGARTPSLPPLCFAPRQRLSPSFLLTFYYFYGRTPRFRHYSSAQSTTHSSDCFCSLLPPFGRASLPTSLVHPQLPWSQPCGDCWLDKWKGWHRDRESLSSAQLDVSAHKRRAFCHVSY